MCTFTTYNQVNLKDEYIEVEFDFLASESAEESKTQYEIYQLKCPDDKPLYAGSGPYSSEKCLNRRIVGNFCLKNRNKKL